MVQYSRSVASGKIYEAGSFLSSSRNRTRKQSWNCDVITHQKSRSQEEPSIFHISFSIFHSSFSPDQLPLTRNPAVRKGHLFSIYHFASCICHFCLTICHSPEIPAVRKGHLFFIYHFAFCIRHFCLTICHSPEIPQSGRVAERRINSTPILEPSVAPAGS